eukprot:272769-Chlamydomonas_euryale.AAC.2
MPGLPTAHTDIVAGGGAPPNAGQEAAAAAPAHASGGCDSGGRRKGSGHDEPVAARPEAVTGGRRGTGGGSRLPGSRGRRRSGGGGGVHYCGCGVDSNSVGGDGGASCGTRHGRATAGSWHAAAGTPEGSLAASGGPLHVHGHAAAGPVSGPEAVCQIPPVCARCAGNTAG